MSNKDSIITKISIYRLDLPLIKPYKLSYNTFYSFEPLLIHIIDNEGNDISEWKPMPGVSDLTRIDRQQYVVMQLINELKEFESVNELNSFIKALENSFIIDENLSINKAVEILWTFRNIDLSNVQKFTTPVDYLTLNDGRQVLVLNDTIHNFLKKNSVLDS